MTRDLKTGMALGLLLAVFILFWLSVRSDLSLEMGLSQEVGPKYEFPEDPCDTPNSPALPAPLSADLAEIDVVDEPEIQSPNVPDLTIYKEPEKVETEKFHIVQPDENLSDISFLYYGTPNKWKKIAKANRDAIPDANRIKPGTKIIIPD